MTGNTDIAKGDKVILNRCPVYQRHGSHKAKVIGDPVPSSNGMIAPVRLICSGGREYANYPCDQMIKVRNVKVKKPAIVTAIVLGVVAILGLWLVGNYNSLVSSNNAVDNTKAKIDTQLERRYELIDNMVASVKGSQAQESDVFGKIAEARKIGASAKSEGEEANANAAIDQQIALLPRLQEAYPELRSNDNIKTLMAELQGTAGQVATARDTYNDAVTNYNTNITSFPKNIFAGMFNFQKKELFKASTEANKNPQVKF